MEASKKFEKNHDHDYDNIIVSELCSVIERALDGEDGEKEIETDEIELTIDGKEYKAFASCTAWISYSSHGSGDYDTPDWCDVSVDCSGVGVSVYNEGCDEVDFTYDSEYIERLVSREMSD